jgi:hypothetical protein
MTDVLRFRLPRSLYIAFGVVTGVVIALTLGLCWWAGFFDPLPLVERPMGPYNLLFREHRGPYQGIKVVVNDVAVLYRARQGRQPQVGFAIYYDDPSSARPDSLRSIAGCVTDTLLSGLGAPYQTTVFERTSAIVGTLRLRSFLSYMTGVLRFYPKLRAYVADHGARQSGPVMELYDMAKREIVYIAPLEAVADAAR